MPLTIDLTDRVALVTGTSSGIGLGVAARLAEAGCHVSGSGRSAAHDPGAEAFCRRVQQAGRRALYTPTDLTRPAAPAALVEATLAHFGQIDVVVSNAGHNVFYGAADCTEAGWQYNLDLNLSAHWRLCRAARAALATARPDGTPGVILLMTSNHAWQTLPGCFPYNVAKTALTGLVRSLTLEWSPAIRTVGIAPGFVDTAGNDTWFDTFPDPAAERQRTVDRHPVRRLGTPDEVGAFCAFLASPHAAFAAGTTYLLDGGRSALMQDG